MSIVAPITAKGSVLYLHGLPDDPN